MAKTSWCPHWVLRALGFPLCFLTVARPWASRSFLSGWGMPARLLCRGPLCLFPQFKVVFWISETGPGFRSVHTRDPQTLKVLLGSIVAADMGLFLGEHDPTGIWARNEEKGQEYQPQSHLLWPAICSCGDALKVLVMPSLVAGLPIYDEEIFKKQNQFPPLLLNMDSCYLWGSKIEDKPGF